MTHQSRDLRMTRQGPTFDDRHVRKMNTRSSRSRRQSSRNDFQVMTLSPVNQDITSTRNDRKSVMQLDVIWVILQIRLETWNQTEAFDVLPVKQAVDLRPAHVRQRWRSLFEWFCGGAPECPSFRWSRGTQSCCSYDTDVWIVVDERNTVRDGWRSRTSGSNGIGRLAVQSKQSGLVSDSDGCAPTEGLNAQWEEITFVWGCLAAWTCRLGGCRGVVSPPRTSLDPCRTDRIEADGRLSSISSDPRPGGTGPLSRNSHSSQTTLRNPSAKKVYSTMFRWCVVDRTNLPTCWTLLRPGMANDDTGESHHVNWEWYPVAMPCHEVQNRPSLSSVQTTNPKIRANWRIVISIPELNRIPNRRWRSAMGKLLSDVNILSSIFLSSSMSMEGKNSLLAGTPPSKMHGEMSILVSQKVFILIDVARWREEVDSRRRWDGAIHFSWQRDGSIHRGRRWIRSESFVLLRIEPRRCECRRFGNQRCQFVDDSGKTVPSLVSTLVSFQSYPSEWWVDRPRSSSRGRRDPILSWSDGSTFHPSHSHWRRNRQMASSSPSFTPTSFSRQPRFQINVKILNPFNFKSVQCCFSVVFYK